MALAREHGLDLRQSTNRVGGLQLPMTPLGSWASQMLRLLRLEELVMVRDLRLYDQFRVRSRVVHFVSVSRWGAGCPGDSHNRF